MIGIDVISIERIRKAAESKHFVSRVFAECELEYALSKPDASQTLAGIYAAKEAVAKALKRGFTGLNLKDIVIKHNQNGCPFALVCGQKLEISISHDGGFAVAVAVAGNESVQNIRSALGKISTLIDFNSLPQINSYQAPKRFEDSHKRCYADVRVVGGCPTMIGAPYLSARAALKSGAGLVRLCVAESLKPAYQSRINEEMLMLLPDNNGLICFNTFSLNALIKGADSIVVGMGMGSNPDLVRIISHIAHNFCGTLIIDADGLNALCGNLAVLSGHTCKLILTPHMGEFERLNGQTDSNKNTALSAADFALAHNCTLVLKSHQTLITNGVRSYKNTLGSACMAKGGTGDVLAGVIAALSAHMCAVDACAYACIALGTSALKKEKELGADCVLALDLCNGLEF